MKIHWPEEKIPEGFNDVESYLRHPVYQGVKERFVDDDNGSNADIHRCVGKNANYNLDIWMV